jgi:hypothetical protein
VLSRTCDSEGVLARPATGAGPLHHARDRSALAESQPDQQPVRTRLTGCRHNSRNQLVHTTQQLGAASPSRLLGAQESTRDTITTVQSDGRKHPHDERQQALTPSSPSPASSCLVPFLFGAVSPKPRKTTSSTQPLDSAAPPPPGRQPEASWGTSRGCQAFLSHNVTHCHTLPHVVTHCHTEPHVSHNFTEAHVAHVALLPDLGPRAREGGGRGELCLP